MTGSNNRCRNFSFTTVLFRNKSHRAIRCIFRHYSYWNVGPIAQLSRRLAIVAEYPLWCLCLSARKLTIQWERRYDYDAVPRDGDCMDVNVALNKVDADAARFCCRRRVNSVCRRQSFPVVMNVSRRTLSADNNPHQSSRNQQITALPWRTDRCLWRHTIA